MMDDYYKFIIKDFRKYVEIYLSFVQYFFEFKKEYVYVFYNFYCQFFLQNLFLLVVIKRGDFVFQIIRKIIFVFKFIDIYIMIRLVNWQNINYNILIVVMFSLVKKI